MEVDMEVPVNADAAMRARKITQTELPIPIDDVRLVFKPEDSDKDVVVRYITKGEAFLSWEMEPGSVMPKHRRYVAGTELEIPYPEEQVVGFNATADDTARMLVMENSQPWVPEVLEPPFEASVAEELIPKYARNRTVHEHEYVVGKILQDARSAWYESRQLKSPTVQKHEQEAAARRAREELKAPTQQDIVRMMRNESKRSQGHGLANNAV
jgi:hypothetical protein